jgi:Bacterial antitoxin of type II TA system, VapB
MGAHMKTTIELNDRLLRAAKAAAMRDGTTLRSVVEAALRSHLAQLSNAQQVPFRLRRHPFSGKGLRPEAADAGWDRIRDLSYEGRGG